MRVRFGATPSTAIAASLAFLIAQANLGPPAPPDPENIPEVVLPAPVQVALYGGDRFLAANLESIRAAAFGTYLFGAQIPYPVRAHRVVSKLNGCHEDNYWIGNGALTWGGAADEGLDLLGRATQCRFWDEFPPFFYGFNQHFFRRDTTLARKALEMAADRATVNANAFRSIAVMLSVSAESDARAALALLKVERDNANDRQLKRMLDQRVGRMEGLVELREANRMFRERFGRSPKAPEELLAKGILVRFPEDPMGLGYEFRSGEFVLARAKFLGFD